RRGERLIKGIGTRYEGSVHAVLKNYFVPDQSSQEISVGRFIADIVSEDGVIEIQTSHFKNLYDKLEAFLPVCHVTVVYPVYVNKDIVTISPEGTVIGRRRSPLKGTAYDIFRELFSIAPFLTNKALSIVIVMLECEEYRIKADTDGKREKPHVTDRMPTKLVGEIRIDRPEDWEQLIPCLRKTEFTSTELTNIYHVSRKYASIALSALYKGGILKRLGKRGNAFRYQYYKDTV
ncbi:MAG: hypothetical protein IKR73_08270, partial [Oscillospiraceae bacterium]|nr:hypothetical protein [Oscillospiraceae bacterium]